MRSVLILFALCPSLALAQDDDNDGILNGSDNCISVSNSQQEDDNSDGYGDACVAVSATLGANVTIANGATVGDNASIGDGANLSSTAQVQALAVVGAYVVLGPNATIATRASVGGASTPPPGGNSPTFGSGFVLSRAGEVGADATVGSDNAYGRTVRVGDRLTAASGVSIGYASMIGDDANLGALVVLGNQVSFGNGATLGANVVVGRGVQVGDNADFAAGVVVGPQTQLGDNVQLASGVRIRKDVTIGSNVVVGQGVRIGRDVQLADGVTIGNNVRLSTGVVVPPGVAVPDDSVVGRNVTFTGVAEDCTDGSDNNNNGLLDCEDHACASDPVCDESLQCDDTVDNDNDGDVDCDDMDCVADPACVGGGTATFDVTINTAKLKAQDGNFSRYTTSVQGSSCGSATYVGNIQTGRRYIIDARSVTGSVAVDAGGSQSMDCTFQVGRAKFVGHGLGNPLLLRSRTGFSVNCSGPGNNPDVYGTDWLPKRMEWPATVGGNNFHPTNSHGEEWYVPAQGYNYGSVFESGYSSSYAADLYLGPDCTIGLGSLNYQYFSGYGWPTVSSSAAASMTAPAAQTFQFPR